MFLCITIRPIHCYSELCHFLSMAEQPRFLSSSNFFFNFLPNNFKLLRSIFEGFFRYILFVCLDQVACVSVTRFFFSFSYFWLNLCLDCNRIQNESTHTHIHPKRNKKIFSVLCHFELYFTARPFFSSFHSTFIYIFFLFL